MKHKVAELAPPLLDAAVAIAHGWRFQITPRGFCLATVPDLEHGDGNRFVYFSPSQSWEEGGPIIERERITLKAGLVGIALRIPLTRGMFAEIDDADYETVAGYPWVANGSHGMFYAMAHLYGTCGERRHV